MNVCARSLYVNFYSGVRDKRAAANAGEFLFNQRRCRFKCNKSGGLIAQFRPPHLYPRMIGVCTHVRPLQSCVVCPKIKKKLLLHCFLLAGVPPAVQQTELPSYPSLLSKN